MNPSSPVQMASFPIRDHLTLCPVYLRYPLSYRNLKEMMLERGLTVDHSTVYRWVLFLCTGTVHNIVTDEFNFRFQVCRKARFSDARSA